MSVLWGGSDDEWFALRVVERCGAGESGTEGQRDRQFPRGELDFRRSVDLSRDTAPVFGRDSPAGAPRVVEEQVAKSIERRSTGWKRQI